MKSITHTVYSAIIIIGVSASFLITPFIQLVYGTSLYTNCEGYRAYLDWKGISMYEGMTNTTLVDERIESLELGQEPGTTGPVSEQELICLKEIRQPQKDELRNIIESSGGFDELRKLLNNK